ncbi:UNVERIFIED_CONTAM: Pathogenesis-related protein 2 [Sesamum indicum]
MGAITYDIKIPSSIPAAKMFKSVALDAVTLIPKIMPQAIKSVEIWEGDGEFDPATPLLRVMPWRAFLNITYHVTIVPTAEMGCICKNRSIYHTKGDIEINGERSRKERRRQCSSTPLKLTSKPMPKSQTPYLGELQFTQLAHCNRQLSDFVEKKK